ncbi:ParB/RepB/Spo0J family partition protein [Xylophilus rhododendri]|uniref:ParB/RepB/Spo0J family partition protein n=1 Tax=Xylophilus rhododendri TaxID=2697032 RepID=A0A857J6J2_9BURK|nr:ParB/RepB/Spo0J family partition protein [Xylophilus rhododendri]QHI99337.1 ParB/RepB/Spo0J family partition protein [Xylophilus rhododendri]
MNQAPTTLTAPMASFPDGAVVRLGLDRIVASLTNPRKTFNAEKLSELADSVKTSGVHSPILVRPLPGERLQDTFQGRARGTDLPEFELVYGERRWRASRLAGVPDVPAVVRFLTDDQVLDIQITENLQRDDLLPLEEAEGYQLLMDHSKLSADQVAGKIGKSKAYVYAKLKLLALFQAGRTALREGTIDASKALLIARIPDEKLQAKALQYLVKKDWQGDVPSYRDAANHFQEEFMLRLDKARFKITDASLLPEAGACSTCPKRTGHEPDLFSDVKGPDVCTFPPCFHKKQEAHSAVVVAKAKEKGQTVIAGTEAKELLVGSYQPKYKGYKRLDDAEDSPTGVPLRKIIGAQMKAEGITPVMIEDHRKAGALIAALPNEVVLRLLKSVDSQANETQEVAKEVREFSEEKKAKALLKAKQQYEQAWRTMLMQQTWNVIRGTGRASFTMDVHRVLVKSAIYSLSVDDATALSDFLGLGKVSPTSALLDYAKETPDPDQLHLLVIMQRDSGARHGENAGLMLVAGIAYASRLPAIISMAKADAEAKFLPKSRSPKASLPLPPAAQASGVRGGGKEKVKGKKGPAAPADEIAKTSKEHASAQISAALQAAEGSGLGGADAPQRDEAGPVLRQAPAPSSSPVPADAVEGTGSGAAVAAQGDEGQAVLRQPGAAAAPFALGQAVRFKEGIRGPNRHIRKVAGKEGTIEARNGDTWYVRTGPASYDLATARSDEIEAMAPPPGASDGFVISQRIQVSTNVAEHLQGFAGQLGRIVGRSKSGYAWDVRLDPVGKKKARVETFAEDELEVAAA